MSKILELFGHTTQNAGHDWSNVVAEQRCPFVDSKCFKVRKNEPDVSIGTCAVLHGKNRQPIVICPKRFLKRNQLFVDCLHLLTTHQPGNELHVVSEIRIPGGSVDHFLVSTRNNKVVDFVGVEVQSLDTTGTVWPERQRLLRELGASTGEEAEDSNRPYGMNWKMTAKTILVQLHHKSQTFEHVNKKLVLVIQDVLLNYIRREFDFAGLQEPAMLGDSVHFHPYEFTQEGDSGWSLVLGSRLSTDATGIERGLGLQTSPRLEFEQIANSLQKKISKETLFMPI